MSELILDQYNGITEYYSQDAMTGQITIRTSQDVAPILKSNQQAREIETGNWKGDFHHVASIPKELWTEWWHELGSNPFSKENKRWVMAKLNDGDFSKLRVKTGRI